MSAAGRLTLLTTVLSAFGAGVTGGLFFAFSTSVMAALGRQPAPQGIPVMQGIAVMPGIAVMQGINVSILNPASLTLLLGSTAPCAVLLPTSPFTGVPGAGWRVTSATLFLVGAIGVTTVVSVPLNNALAAIDPTSAEGAALWGRYLSRWTAANHLRTAASIGSALLLAVGAEVSCAFWQLGRVVIPLPVIVALVRAGAQRRSGAPRGGRSPSAGWRPVPPASATRCWMRAG